MKLCELLDVAGISVNVKYGVNHIRCVSDDNPLISRHVFDMNVKDIKAGEDAYGNYFLEVEIE